MYVCSGCSSGTAPFALALICNKVHDFMRWFKMHKGFAITMTCNQKLKWHISSFKRPVIKMDQVTIMTEQWGESSKQVGLMTAFFLSYSLDLQ